MAPTDSEPLRLRPTDETILAAFATARHDYPALVARRRGIDVPVVRRRCRVLADRELLEQVSIETTYRITRRGERVLRARTASAGRESGERPPADR